MSHSLAELVRHYDRPGPRYTGYPMPPAWRDDFPEEELVAGLERAAGSDAPLSFYAHLPFCKRRCAYCGCNVTISPYYDPVEPFLQTLERELDLFAAHLKDRRGLLQLHWGGGTPTYLKVPELERVFRLITARFPLLPGAEVSLEADPTFMTEDQLPALRALGFNRVSFGVQDLDEGVQELITRGQTWDHTLSAVGQARSLGFEGINIDLVYGLPGQTLGTFGRTLDEVIALAPSRLAVYGFAYLPKMMPFQRSIPTETLPSPDLRLELLLLASEKLEAAGYVPVGMDHFAHPEDELAKAVHDGRIIRNFMGYAVQAGPDMVSVGPSAISDVGGVYHQNEKILSKWEKAVDSGHFPMHKGHTAAGEDRMRRWIIHQVMGRFELRWSELAEKWGVDGPLLFAEALGQLREEEPWGTVKVTDEGVFVTPLGRRFVRNLAMPFDAYLPLLAGKTFSRTV
ncbi:MAG: oxygen-independent coproporphyrinogen III oxidase [Acidobacteria bacterium]|nr:oxygen-independent coproporphyrinogen III oxidase [Acidobacteriota bacterium]